MAQKADIEIQKRADAAGNDLTKRLEASCEKMGKEADAAIQKRATEILKTPIQLTIAKNTYYGMAGLSVFAVGLGFIGKGFYDFAHAWKNPDSKKGAKTRACMMMGFGALASLAGFLSIRKYSSSTPAQDSTIPTQA